MRLSRPLISVALLCALASSGQAQRCSTGSADMPANASPEQLAAANVDILFDGIPLTREQRRKAVAIYADAVKAMLKLDYRVPDFQSKYTELLAKRNEGLWALAPNDSARAKLEMCFRKMNQPVPTKGVPS